MLAFPRTSIIAALLLLPSCTQQGLTNSGRVIHYAMEDGVITQEEARAIIQAIEAEAQTPVIPPVLTQFITGASTLALAYLGIRLGVAPANPTTVAATVKHLQNGHKAA